MPRCPVFPEFKPIELADQALIAPLLEAFEPEVSELTFTNLFVWRNHYGTRWCVDGPWLLIIEEPLHGAPYAMMPVGPAGRREVTLRLLDHLAAAGWQEPVIERADARYVAELGEGWTVEPLRDHFDYVYRTEDLISLAGRKLHSKKNHLNKFRRLHDFEYRALDRETAYGCFELLASWCDMKLCQEDSTVKAECEAAHEALTNLDTLRLTGGVILIEGRTVAFSIGEMLNPRTAVVHFEKAETSFDGLYTAMNQQFCENAWAGVPFINREQDLGQEGLRRAKTSYCPDHMVEKFAVRRTL